MKELIKEELARGLMPRPARHPGPKVKAMRDFLKEFADFPSNRPEIHPDHALDVPLFFHFMAGDGGNPAFSSPTLNPGGTFTATFGGEATFNYHCNFHQEMHGTVVVSAGAPSNDAYVIIEDGPPPRFNPSTVPVKPGGTVQIGRAHV